jgi:hypothetical protein
MLFIADEDGVLIYTMMLSQLGEPGPVVQQGRQRAQVTGIQPAAQISCWDPSRGLLTVVAPAEVVAVAPVGTVDVPIEA